jgi:hypothetical protein
MLSANVSDPRIDGERASYSIGALGSLGSLGSIIGLDYVDTRRLSHLSEMEVQQ